MHVVYVVVVLTLGVVVTILATIAAAKRSKELSVLARRLGLKFNAKSGRLLAKQYAFLDRLATGDDRYAFNVISGRYLGHDVLAFDFHYKVKSGKETTHYYFSFFVLTLPRSFPELRVTKEGLLSKLGQALGFDDIDFESAEFSRAFCVRSPDRKFAYDVCNPQMMEYLLANRDLSIEIERSALALAFDSQLSAPEIEMNLKRLIAVRSHIPDFLFASA